MLHEIEGEHFVNCLTLEVDKCMYYGPLLLSSYWLKMAQTIEPRLHTAWYNMTSKV